MRFGIRCLGFVCIMFIGRACSWLVFSMAGGGAGLMLVRRRCSSVDVVRGRGVGGGRCI